MRRIQTLNAALNTGDRDIICEAISRMILGKVGVSALALEVGVDRTTFYRLSKTNLTFDLFLKILKALNLRTVAIDQPKIGSTKSLVCEKLNVAFGSDEIQQILSTLSEIIRAQKNVGVFAKKANLSRSRLYHSFNNPHTPRIGTVLDVLNALDLRLAVTELADLDSWVMPQAQP